MDREGHLGASLLVYAPVGTGLALGGFDDLALLGGVTMVGLSMVPDWDQRVPFVAHRGVTHTVAFALLVGAVVAGLGAQVADQLPAGRRTLAAFGFLVGTLSVLAHLAADALTPAGIRPLWPLSDRHVSLDLTRASSPVANHALLALGVVAAGGCLLVLAQ